MAEPLKLKLPDVAATAALGRTLALALTRVGPDRFMAGLHGELGAGKTALARAVLAGLGHEGRVPSPTYTLVEPYDTPDWRVLHVDLYRLGDAAELDYLGLTDEFTRGTLLLAEWPERGGDRLPAADLDVFLEAADGERTAVLRSSSPAGAAVCREIAAERGLPDPR